MKKEALFLPIVNLSSDGRVTIDWSGSFDHTTDEEGNVIYDDEELTQQFDEILTAGTGMYGTSLLDGSDSATAKRLRNLADYIETQEGSNA